MFGFNLPRYVFILVTLFPIQVTSSFAQINVEKLNKSEREFVDALFVGDLSSTDKIREYVEKHSQILHSRVIKDLFFKASLARATHRQDKAIFLYDAIISVADILGDSRSKYQALYGKGDILYFDKDYDRALELFLQSYHLVDKEKYVSDYIVVASIIGAVFSQKGLPRAAEEYYMMAIDCELRSGQEGASSLPSRIYGLARAYSGLGGIYYKNMEYQKSIESYQSASVYYGAIIDRDTRSVTLYVDHLYMLGRLYRLTGNSSKALSLYDKAASIAVSRKLKGVLLDIYNSTGVLYLEQEDYSRAIYYFFMGLDLSNSELQHLGREMVLLNLGVVEQRKGNLVLAQKYYQDSVNSAKQINNQDVIIAAGEGLGAVYREKGAYDQAMDILDRSLSLAKDLNDNVRIAEILWRKAEVHYDLEQYDQVIELGSRSLELARNLQFSNLYILASTLVAKSLIKRNDPASAESMLRSTVNEIENQRNRIAGREMSQQLYFENKVIPYHLLIDLNIRKADVFSALSNAERVKGRVLLDALRNGRALPQREMSGIEKDEQRRLNQSIVNLNRALRAELEKETNNQESIDKVKSELTDARLKYSTFLDLLQSSRTSGAGQREIEVSPTLDPASLKKLPSDTVFISFTVTDNRTWVFLITNSDGVADVSAKALDIARKDLREIISDLHKTLSARSLGFNTVSRKVYDLLISPLEGSFTGKKKLCVIPDDILWDAPFQTLIRRNGRYLIEDYAISYAPSLSVYLQMRAKENHASSGDSNSLLAFGNPLVGEEAAQNLRDQQRGGSFEPLPHAEVEVRTVLPMFRDKSSRALIREEAEERKFKSLAGGYRTLHLATHGVLDNQNPLYSYLLLSRKDDDPEEDGILEAREILEMELNADLAVLSACETARGRIGSGEGMVGMAWAFFVAGCRSTIVSQWRVDSEGTAKFMIDFYRSLERTRRTGGMSKSEALRAAALGMVSNPRYRHPYYWAGFILIGLDN